MAGNNHLQQERVQHLIWIQHFANYKFTTNWPIISCLTFSFLFSVITIGNFFLIFLQGIAGSPLTRPAMCGGENVALRADQWLGILQLWHVSWWLKVILLSTEHKSEEEWCAQHLHWSVMTQQTIRQFNTIEVKVPKTFHPLSPRTSPATPKPQIFFIQSSYMKIPWLAHSSPCRIPFLLGNILLLLPWLLVLNSWADSYSGSTFTTD